PPQRLLHPPVARLVHRLGHHDLAHARRATLAVRVATGRRTDPAADAELEAVDLHPPVRPLVPFRAHVPLDVPVLDVDRHGWFPWLCSARDCRPARQVVRSTPATCCTGRRKSMPPRRARLSAGTKAGRIISSRPQVSPMP